MTERTKKKKEEPTFTKEQILSFDRYQERRDLLGVLLEPDQTYAFAEIEKRIQDFMKGKVNT